MTSKSEKRKPSKFIGFRLPIPEVQALDMLAGKDNRTRNGLIRHVLAKYIIANGYEARIPEEKEDVAEV